MFLAVDVGNTNTVLGVYQDAHVVDAKLVGNWRIRTKRDCTSDELGVLLTQLFFSSSIPIDAIEGIIVSSVVPPINSTIDNFCHRYLNQTPIFVGPDIKIGMPILYDNPYDVGADRIVNAVAAYERYKTNIIIVDFGTATTLDCISAEGQYLGGAISPGVMISCEALFQRASKLPRVEIFSRPESVVAKDTVSSMNVGVLYGYAGLVDGLVGAINAELGVKCKVLATGGLAKLIATYSRTIEEIDDLLTLRGLLIIFQRNQR